MRIFICTLVVLFFRLNIQAEGTQPIELKLIFLETLKPFIVIDIEGHEYLELLDLGADIECDLRDTILQNVKKETFSQSHIINYKGVSRKSLKYLIPKIKLNDFVLENIIVSEETDEGMKSTTVWDDQAEIDKDAKRAGAIGNKILERGNLLLDFPNKKAYFVRDLQSRQINDYLINTWMKVPFEWNRIGIILKVETDLGVLKFLFDTGATHTFIYQGRLEGQNGEPFREKMSQLISSKFIIGERNFGKQRLIELKNGITFADEQGIIGMDFLRNHTFYIDYPNKVLYIKPSLEMGSEDAG